MGDNHHARGLGHPLKKYFLGSPIKLRLRVYLLVRKTDLSISICMWTLRYGVGGWYVEHSLLGAFLLDWGVRLVVVVVVASSLRAWLPSTPAATASACSPQPQDSTAWIDNSPNPRSRNVCVIFMVTSLTNPGVRHYTCLMRSGPVGRQMGTTSGGSVRWGPDSITVTSRTLDATTPTTTKIMWCRPVNFWPARLYVINTPSLFFISISRIFSLSDLAMWTMLCPPSTGYIDNSIDDSADTKPINIIKAYQRGVAKGGATSPTSLLPKKNLIFFRRSPDLIQYLYMRVA